MKHPINTEEQSLPIGNGCIGVLASVVANPFELTVACRLPDDVQLSFQAHFIPAGV